MKLFFIHGANASPRSYNYIAEKLKTNLPIEYADYSSTAGFYNNLAIMREQTAQDDWFLVGHSLGGVYAAHLLESLESRFCGAVTLSTPYGGSELSDMLMFVHPFTRLFRDTATQSRPIRSCQSIVKNCKPKNWTAVVTASGRAPYLPGYNDGVVSVESQACLSDYMKIIDIDVNHYEIMQSQRAIKIIQGQIDRLQ